MALRKKIEGFFLFFFNTTKSSSFIINHVVKARHLQEVREGINNYGSNSSKKKHSSEANQWSWVRHKTMGVSHCWILGNNWLGI